VGGRSPPKKDVHPGGVRRSRMDGWLDYSLSRAARCNGAVPGMCYSDSDGLLRRPERVAPSQTLP